MKAVVFDKWGPPENFRVVEREQPEPAADEALIRVKASTVTAQDYRGRSRKIPLFAMPLVVLTGGILKPKQQVFGTEFSGVVEAVGAEVTAFKVGDEVFGSTGTGAYQQFITRPERAITHKPANISFEEAAALPWGGMTGLHFVREVGAVQPGQSVLVYGASSGCGTYFVQLAKHFGAEVTAVCSGANAALMHELGADHVVDYTTEDFTATDKRYDLVLDAVAKSSFMRCKRILKDDGVYLTTVPSVPLIVRSLWTARFGRKQAKFSLARFTKEGIELLAALAAEGALRAHIDRVYAMDEAAAMFRYAETGRKRGNVVMRIE